MTLGKCGLWKDNPGCKPSQGQKNYNQNFQRGVRFHAVSLLQTVGQQLAVLRPISSKRLPLTKRMMSQCALAT
jgi:hypothetical protein